jgi:hypothetical protein
VGSKYYGREILKPPPPYTIRVGFRILWSRDIRRRRLKILWLRHIEPPSPIHLKGWDSENFGHETLTYWFPWLRGGVQNIMAAKYRTPLPFSLRVGFRNHIVFFIQSYKLLIPEKKFLLTLESFPLGISTPSLHKAKGQINRLRVEPPPPNHG